MATKNETKNETHTPLLKAALAFSAELSRFGKLADAASSATTTTTSRLRH